MRRQLLLQGGDVLPVSQGNTAKYAIQMMPGVGPLTLPSHGEDE
jgi:hypothetical protein